MVTYLLQGSAIPPKSLSIRYYTYYIILRINTVDIMGPLLLVLTYFSNIVLQRSDLRADSPGNHARA